LEQGYVRYNSDGDKLKCVGNGLWIPEGCELVHKSELDEEVIRPKIPVAMTIWSIIVSAGTYLALALLLSPFFIGISMLSLFYLLMAACAFINMKRIIMFIILVYQRFAPKRVRNQCLFEPSCSSFSILVLEKYGTLIGVIKAIKRLKRCKPPNGGEDYP